MNVEILVPPVGESIVEAVVGVILKPSGSIVKADEEILELETDKVNQAVYAPAAGKVQLTVKTGDVVKIGQAIGSIDTAAANAKSEGPEIKQPMKVKEQTPPIAAPLPPKPTPQPISSPPSSPPEPRKASFQETGSQTRKKMPKLRKIIAERLVAVKNQTAMLTTFNEVDMSSVIAVREKERENFEKKHGVRLGFMSFFVKASCAALQAFPDINARIDGDEIVYNSSCHIAVAVSTDKGLMVPVIRNAETLSYADVERKLKEFADQARLGTISVDALQGGTFTISNGGVYGSLLSTPILNPPQSGILGMHNIVKRPIAIDDQVVIRPMMYLALSYDHRIVDGKDSISFLVHLKKNLEDPARLLLDL